LWSPSLRCTRLSLSPSNFIPFFYAVSSPVSLLFPAFLLRQIARRINRPVLLTTEVTPSTTTSPKPCASPSPSSPFSLTFLLEFEEDLGHAAIDFLRSSLVDIALLLCKDPLFFFRRPQDKVLAHHYVVPPGKSSLNLRARGSCQPHPSASSLFFSRCLKFFLECNDIGASIPYALSPDGAL